MTQPRTLIMALPLLLVVFLAIVLGPPSKTQEPSSPEATPTVAIESGKLSCTFTELPNHNFLITCERVP